MRSWSGVFQTSLSEPELARGEEEVRLKEHALRDEADAVEDALSNQANRIARILARLERRQGAAGAARVRSTLSALALPPPTSAAWEEAIEARSAALAARHRACDVLEVATAQRSSALRRLLPLTDELEAQLAAAERRAANTSSDGTLAGTGAPAMSMHA
jgi:hypothetical protein